MSDSKSINISEDDKVVLSALLDVFYVNLMTFANYINGDSENVADESYAKFILFAMEEKLKGDQTE